MLDEHRHRFPHRSPTSRVVLCAASVVVLLGCSRSEPTPGSGPAHSTSASASAAPGTTSAASASAPPASPAPPLVPISLAKCGELSALGLEEKRFPLLAGRLTVGALKGTEAPPREYSVMWAPKSQEQETRTMVAAGEDRFVVLADQLFQLAPGPEAFDSEAKMFLQEAHRQGAPEPRFERFELGGGLRAMAVFPGKLTALGDAALMLSLLVAGADGVLYHVSFYVSPQLTNPSCQKMARQIAATLTPGPRQYERKARTVQLETQPKLTIRLPDDYVLVTQPGPDFTAIYVHKLKLLGQFPGKMYIYVGHQTSRPLDDDAVVVHKGRLLGSPVEWMGKKDGLTMNVAVQIPDQAFLMVNLQASRDASFLNELRAVAESIALSK